MRMNGQELPGLLQHFPILSSLNGEEKKWLAEVSERKLAPKHSFVYLADEPGDFICLPISGAVKIGIYAPDGREIIKHIQHPYSLFGELALAGEARRAEFAATMNREVDYLKVKVDDFKQIIDQNRPLAQALLNFMGERLRKAERHWESLIVKDVRSRIVDFLKESAGEHGRQVGYEMLVKHGLTQQDIANLVGASRQTVTAILNELRKSNLIHFNRNTILIRDMNKLN
jgi:CRP/FNR family cyclic AMP-dependent transcriptional regulator